MEIKVPENIEQQIADAMIETCIGDAIKDSVAEIAKKCAEDDYNSPVRRAIEQIGVTLITRMLENEETRAFLEQQIITAFSDERIVKKAIEMIFREKSY